MLTISRLAKIADTLETAGQTTAANQLKKIATDFYKSALKELDIKNIQPIFEAMMKNTWPEEKVVNSFLSVIDTLPKLQKLEENSMKAALVELGWDSNVPVKVFKRKLSTIEDKIDGLLLSLPQEKQKYFKNKLSQLKTLLQKIKD